MGWAERVRARRKRTGRIEGRIAQVGGVGSGDSGITGFSGSTAPGEILAGPGGGADPAGAGVGAVDDPEVENLDAGAVGALAGEVQVEGEEGAGGSGRGRGSIDGALAVLEFAGGP